MMQNDEICLFAYSLVHHPRREIDGCRDLRHVAAVVELKSVECISVIRDCRRFEQCVEILDDLPGRCHCAGVFFAESGRIELPNVPATISARIESTLLNVSPGTTSLMRGLRTNVTTLS